MGFHVEFQDDELPQLKVLLDRALNTWDTAPKWAWALDAKVVAHMNDLKRAESVTKKD